MINEFLNRAQQNQTWLMQSYVQGLILSFIAYGIYLEMSPTMGGIFIRLGPDNRKHFNLGGILPMLKYPFQSFNFWRPDYWDLNFIIFTQVGTGAYMLLKNYLN